MESSSSVELAEITYRVPYFAMGLVYNFGDLQKVK
jgi:hypothetical protein